jgi:hypothetical protein
MPEPYRIEEEANKLGLYDQDNQAGTSGARNLPDCRRAKRNLERVGVWSLLAFSALAASGAPPARPPLVLFSVEKGEQAALLDPIAMVDGSGTIKSPFPPDSDAAARRFVERWLTPGRAYPVYFGGAPTGTVTVRERPGDPGISLQAPSALKSSAVLQGRTMALAVSRPVSPGLGARPLQRRPLTAPERAALLAAAQAEFRRNGVPDPVARAARIVTAAALNLDGAGRTEIAARLQAAAGAGPRWDLFVIAEPVGASGFAFGLTVANRDKRTPTMEDMNYVEQDLVDALDVNGDGIAEVVTRSVYYESHDYTVFQKRAGGKWRKVYRGAGGGV